MDGRYKNAEKIFNYLFLRDDEIEKSDLIIGFGHFDMNIPIHCGEMFRDGYGESILFTGGIGAGTADLNGPEAQEFKSEVLRKFDSISERDIIIETNSTNTGENILFSEKVSKNINSEFCFEKGIKSIVAVASPYRQRRVFLTMKKLFPNIKVYNSPPETDFNREVELFGVKNQNLMDLVYGEIERLIIYPQKGFIEKEPIPVEIIKAYEDGK